MKAQSAASAVLPLALIIALSACSVPDPDSQSSEPSTVGSPAPTYEPPEANSGPTSARAVDPGWDTAAQESDGTFLSMHEAEDDLEFTAVDSSGEVLWTAKRPRVCSGFLVTRTKEGPVAVLMDQDSSLGDSLATTATGYDLATGDELWGPTETPGPLLGNGLVFAGPPKDFIGAGGPRTALDPATGEEVAAEDDNRSSQVIALLGDHVVRSQDTEIVGEDLDGRKLWTRPAADFGMSAPEAREAPWEPIGKSHALAGEAEGQSRTLIDLRSGATVESDIDEAGFDPESSTLVTAGDRLRGYDDDGSERWSMPLPEDTEIAAVGAGLVFLDPDSGGTETGGSSDDADRPGRSHAARSARDGNPVNDDTAQPGTAQPDIALLDATEQLGIPHHISETGAALIGDPQSPLLVTNQD